MAIISISGRIGSGKDTVAKMIQCLDAGYKDKESLIAVAENAIIDQSEWQIKRFADKMKDSVCSWIGCTREQLEDRKFKEKPLGQEWSYWIYKGEKYDYLSSDKQFFRDKGLKLHHHTPRSLLQLLGTDAGREIIHPNIWVNALMSGYRDEIKAGKNKYGDPENWLELPKWVIPDTRFPNEAKAIRDRNGILIRINRTKIFTKEFEDGSKVSVVETPPEFTKVTQHPSETALDGWTDWDYVINNNGNLEDLFKKVTKIYNEITQ
jgi:hypothetical protein